MDVGLETPLARSRRERRRTYLGPVVAVHASEDSDARSGSRIAVVDRLEGAAFVRSSDQRGLRERERNAPAQLLDSKLSSTGISESDLPEVVAVNDDHALSLGRVLGNLDGVVRGRGRNAAGVKGPT